DLTLKVAVASDAPASVSNVASIANSTIDGGVPHDGNVDVATVIHPDLSGSTLSVLDLNGGDVLPGDTLRYSLTLNESAGGPANAVSVSATLPSQVGGLVVSAPPGSTDNSTGGQVAVSGITVPAS